ncbi:restriction alleviation protein, Lar family [Salmonella enterica]|nr:restriction alleviation protein, Lar family [Salmonella enterica]EAY7465372.1 restriction alleviation protein, Lar family [Salmonella enterica]EBN6688763.1 restriction alleviation protein, Lar family [Salmonella enterica]HAE4722214.1 restriction alleviation protein, Lar family [Salmonella enterica subsp. salamae serovar 47:a:1,5]
MTTITNSKLTDERVSNAMLIRLIQWADQHNSHYVAAALCELQERRKADNFYTAQPASERERIRHEHAEWSDATFGNVGPIGPLKHLLKEALETAAEPDDLSEWADMQFLLWDAQRRAGITDEQITLAMREKLEVNKARQWPEPKDGEPRLHIKEQPAPLMLDKDELLPCPFCGGKARQVTIEQDDDPNFGGDVITCTECGASSHVEFGFKENLKSAWNSRAAMLQGKFRDLSQPVDPQVAEYEQIMLQAGWVMVPKEPTDEMIAAAMECDDVVFDSTDPTAFCVQYREIYYSMVTAAPKPELTSE